MFREKKKLLELTVFGSFFHGYRYGSGFSRSDSDFLGDPDPGLGGEKSDTDPDKRTRIRNTGHSG